MTIGFVLDDTLDKPDGVQIAIRTIATELVSRGHEVHFIVARTNSSDEVRVHSVADFINVKFNGNSVRTPLPAKRSVLKKLFSEISFDVLHVQMPYSPLFAGRVIKYAPKDVRIIGTFHILPYNKWSTLGTWFLGRALNKFTLRRFHAVCAVSEPALRFLESTHRMHGTVIPNPVNFHFYQKHKNKQKKTTLKPIVFVGRFDERKGVRQLVEAYELLPEAVRAKSPLIMCGKGPLHQDLKEYSDRQGLMISFPGFVDEQQKATYLSQAAVAVFPSTAGESFGIVLVEAMSAGAGVTLAGDNPGYTSVMSRWPEILFNPNDTHTFSVLLRDALESRALIAIGKEQHKYAQSFDSGVVADQLEKLYL